MRRLNLYLETTVWNFYYADDAPEKKEATRHFFEQVQYGAYEIFISDFVYREIANATEGKRKLLFNLIGDYHPNELDITEDVLRIADLYIEEEVLPQRSINDSRHVAIATVYEMDAVISWNLKHIANLKRMEKVNGVNLKEGYSKRIELITPMEVSNG